MYQFPVSALVTEHFSHAEAHLHGAGVLSKLDRGDLKTSPKSEIAVAGLINDLETAGAVRTEVIGMPEIVSRDCRRAGESISSESVQAWASLVRNDGVDLGAVTPDVRFLAFSRSFKNR